MIGKLTKITVISICVSMVLALSGCAKDETTKQIEPSKAETTVEIITEATTTEKKTTEKITTEEPTTEEITTEEPTSEVVTLEETVTKGVDKDKELEKIIAKKTYYGSVILPYILAHEKKIAKNKKDWMSVVYSILRVSDAHILKGFRCKITLEGDTSFTMVPKRIVDEMMMVYTGNKKSPEEIPAGLDVMSYDKDAKAYKILAGELGLAYLQHESHKLLGGGKAKIRTYRIINESEPNEKKVYYDVVIRYNPNAELGFTIDSYKKINAKK